MHVYTGVSDCEGIIKEQASARMVFPGPLPVIRTGSKARCLAVSCSVLQCVTVCCSAFQFLLYALGLKPGVCRVLQSVTVWHLPLTYFL